MEDIDHPSESDEDCTNARFSIPSKLLLHLRDYGLLHTILADATSGFTNFLGLLKHSENPTLKGRDVATPLQAFSSYVTS